MQPEDRGQDAVNFFHEHLTHTKGVFAGKPFTLIPWQEKVIREIFGTIKPNGFRQYTTAYVEMGKKNGKSELGAGIALYGLFMDAEPGAEIYCVARTRNQAGNVFRVAAQMVRNKPELDCESRIVDSTKTIYLREDPSSYLKVLSADAAIEDGCNPHMVIFDELHRQTNRDLWDIFKFGKGTRSQPLLFSITTAGVIGESPICEQQHEYAAGLLSGTFTDPSYYPAIYAIDETEDWTYEGEPASGNKLATGWYKANPSLGHFLSIETLREDFKTALEMPAEQNSFRRFRLSQWVGQETRAIPMDKWLENGKRGFNLADLPGKQCIGGLDLSTVKDMTAFVLDFQQGDDHLWLPFLFLPEEDLHRRAIKDGWPYDLWAKQGFIHLTPGNEVDYRFIRKKINECADIYNIKEIAYDRWNATSLIHDLTDDGHLMVPIGQGFASMNAPTAEMLSLIRTGRLIHPNNPCLNKMADCFAIKPDPAGNIKPSKPDRVRSKKKIDGIVAGINALARSIVLREAEPKYQMFVL